MIERRAWLLGGIDPRTALGVEIGALHAPLLVRTEGRVVYVDYAPTAVLRQNFDRPGIDPADLVAVDVVWGETPLAAALGEPADLIVASHVIEHVPDLIAWLGDLHAALRPGGVLALAVPDRRGSFDAWRNDSSIAEVVAAHLEARHRPAAAQIFEAACYAHAAATAQPWRPETGDPLPRRVLDGLDDIYRWLRDKPPAGYTDVHCWVFTPASFLTLAEALHRIGCFGYLIDRLAAGAETLAGEFLVRLRAVPADDPAIPRSIAVARAGLGTAPATGAEAALASLLASRSWRLTAPLRAGSAWWQRLAGRR